MVHYGERLILQSKELFDNYGFVVDAKRVYFFVSTIRERIINGINRLLSRFSAPQINGKLSKVYTMYAENLKRIADVEIEKMQNAIERDVYVKECWEMYKVLMFEMGFDAITDLKILAFSEARTLVDKIDEMRLDITSKITQVITELSTTHAPFFSVRSRINTFVRLKLPPKKLKKISCNTSISDRR